MSSCNSNGTLTVSDSSTVSFDASTGVASFSDLLITQKGMYMLIIDVRATNYDAYNFACLSTPILVKGSGESVLTSSSSSQGGSVPNIYLTFSGNYSQQTADTLKQFETMIYNCLLVKYGLLMQSRIQLYEGSIKAVVDVSGSASSYANLIADMNASNFSLAPGVLLQAAAIDGKAFTFNTQSNGGNGGGGGGGGGSNEISAASQKNEENNAVNQT